MSKTDKKRRKDMREFYKQMAEDIEIIESNLSEFFLDINHLNEQLDNYEKINNLKSNIVYKIIIQPKLIFLKIKLLQDYKRLVEKLEIDYVEIHKEELILNEDFYSDKQFENEMEVVNNLEKTQNGLINMLDEFYIRFQKLT